MIELARIWIAEQLCWAAQWIIPPGNYITVGKPISDEETWL
jgi:hypothetical protein